MKGISGLLAFVGLLVAAAGFYFYRRDASTPMLALFIVGVLTLLVFGGMFLAGRINKGEDIHITE